MLVREFAHASVTDIFLLQNSATPARRRHGSALRFLSPVGNASLSKLTVSVHVADISVRFAYEICSQHLRFLRANVPRLLGPATKKTPFGVLLGGPSRNRTYTIGFGDRCSTTKLWTRGDRLTIPENRGGEKRSHAPDLQATMLT